MEQLNLLNAIKLRRIPRMLVTSILFPNVPTTHNGAHTTPEQWRLL